MCRVMLVIQRHTGVYSFQVFEMKLHVARCVMLGLRPGPGFCPALVVSCAYVLTLSTPCGEVGRSPCLGKARSSPVCLTKNSEYFR